MKIQTRLALLLAAVLALSCLAFFVFRQSHAREARFMIASTERERSALLDRLLELTGRSLEQYTDDYSYWDEMVAFVGTGDKRWAKINLENSLPDIEAQLVWVLRPDGTLVYGLSHLEGAALRTPPIPAADLTAPNATERFSHFFLNAPAGPVEMRGMPVQPSDDAARITKPQGWLFVGRLWDAAHLKSLGAVAESEVYLTRDGRTTPGTRNSEIDIHLRRELRDWRGETVRVLHLRYQPVALERLREDSRTDSAIFLAFGLALAGLIAFSTRRWISRPLRELNASLLQHDPAPLAKLTGRTDEFGLLAQQVGKSFADQTALNREIEERRSAEKALRKSEENLRRAMEHRSRLGRDLHDGVIQSIYATGLGLEGVRGLLRADPTAAERQLEVALQSLNATIREVRAFITGIESENPPRETFVRALTQLVETVRAASPVRLAVDLDESLAAEFSVGQEIQALQVIREALSNALRHGQPTAIEISLRRQDGDPTLSIRDDGTGFDPAKRAGTGRGLANLAARAAEIGAVFLLDSAPGKGTRVILRFVSATG
jgi:signal transduction histidine kinase